MRDLIPSSVLRHAAVAIGICTVLRVFLGDGGPEAGVLVVIADVGVPIVIVGAAARIVFICSTGYGRQDGHLDTAVVRWMLVGINAVAGGILMSRTGVSPDLGWDSGGFVAGFAVLLAITAVVTITAEIIGRRWRW